MARSRARGLLLFPVTFASVDMSSKHNGWQCHHAIDEMGYKLLGMVRRGKRGLGLHCLFLTWFQHQAHPRKMPRPSFSAPLEDLALPVGGCGSQPWDVPGPGIPAPLLRGVWELSGELLFQLGGKTNSPQHCLLDGGKK